MADPNWTDVNNTQSAGWTDVLRPTTITDEAVFGGANFGVTVFAGQVAALYDPSYTKWSRIDDRQTPNWAPIDAV
jgi:hypothetical protein